MLIFSWLSFDVSLHEVSRNYVSQISLITVLISFMKLFLFDLLTCQRPSLKTITLVTNVSIYKSCSSKYISVEQKRLNARFSIEWKMVNTSLYCANFYWEKILRIIWEYMGIIIFLFWVFPILNGSWLCKNQKIV